MATSVTTRVPLDIGAIHFIGIGGIGMSGIAEIMHNLGYKVQGSDTADNANVRRLRAMGIPVAVGHKPQNLNGAHAVVYSSAVKPGNIEFDEARRLALPVPAHGHAHVAGEERARHAEQRGHDDAELVVAGLDGACDQAHDQAHDEGTEKREHGKRLLGEYRRR